jgi:hypothetical protein
MLQEKRIIIIHVGWPGVTLCPEPLAGVSSEQVLLSFYENVLHAEPVWGVHYCTQTQFISRVRT